MHVLFLILCVHHLAVVISSTASMTAVEGTASNVTSLAITITNDVDVKATKAETEFDPFLVTTAREDLASEGIDFVGIEIIMAGFFGGVAYLILVCCSFYQLTTKDIARQYPCKKCGKMYEQKTFLKNHMRLRHAKNKKQSNKKDNNCPFCDKICQHQGHLKSHVKLRHEHKYDKWVKRQRAILAGEKVDADLAWLKKETAPQHADFVCSFCKKQCAHWAHLNTHVKMRHPRQHDDWLIDNAESQSVPVSGENAQQTDDGKKNDDNDGGKEAPANDAVNNDSVAVNGSNDDGGVELAVVNTADDVSAKSDQKTSVQASDSTANDTEVAKASRTPRSRRASKSKKKALVIVVDDKNETPDKTLDENNSQVEDKDLSQEQPENGANSSASVVAGEPRASSPTPGNQSAALIDENDDDDAAAAMALYAIEMDGLAKSKTTSHGSSKSPRSRKEPSDGGAALSGVRSQRSKSHSKSKTKEPSMDQAGVQQTDVDEKDVVSPVAPLETGNRSRSRAKSRSKSKSGAKAAAIATSATSSFVKKNETDIKNANLEPAISTPNEPVKKSDELPADASERDSAVNSICSEKSDDWEDSSETKRKRAAAIGVPKGRVAGLIARFQRMA